MMVSEILKSNPFEIFYKDFLRCGKRQIIAILVDENIRSSFLEGLVEKGKQDDNIIKVLSIEKKPYTDPSSAIAMEIFKADFVIELAQSTLLYTKTFRRALNCGTKFYFLSGIKEEDFYRTYNNLDLMLIRELGGKILDKINSSKKIIIISPDSSELKMSNGPKKFIPPIFKRFHYSFIRFHSGIMGKHTKFTFFPAQVVFRGVRFTMSGNVTFNGSIWPLKGLEKLQKPVTFRIRRGLVVDVIDGEHRQIIKKMLKRRKIGDGKSIQHFSIGLNPQLRISGNMLSDERASGVLTLGVGHAHTHFDITMSKPTIFLDEKIILENGQFVENELAVLSKKLIQK
ncbi:hypothetical protein KKB18_00110 [bacterium]|nr:hypothetical protein [bacterium]